MSRPRSGQTGWLRNGLSDARGVLRANTSDLGQSGRRAACLAVSVVWIAVMFQLVGLATTTRQRWLSAAQCSWKATKLDRHIVEEAYRAELTQIVLPEGDLVELRVISWEAGSL